MVDFHQEGILTTLHGLHEIFDTREYLERLEQKLEQYARHTRISLLLPCLYSELSVPHVLDNIVENINRVNYLHHVVVALGGAKEWEQFNEARDFFGHLKKRGLDVKVVWVDGPRMQGILEKIKKAEIPVGVQGKGQSVWLALGYLFAREDTDVVALHDCDVITYDRIFLGRLIEPTANPNNDFQFCKGFYPRISLTERTMKGRVTRLFVVPFVDTMAQIMHEQRYDELSKFFLYHRAFAYPLAGEFSMHTRLARSINIAYDWGLEVSTLSEVYDRVNLNKITQIALARNYEHKHQALSVEDPTQGLHRMVIDITKFFLNYVRSSRVPLDDAFVGMIKHSYTRNARRFIKGYSDDAEVNDLVYERHVEELTAEYFRDFIGAAWEQCKSSENTTQISSWNRVLYSEPSLYDDLLAAVEEDNAES